MIEVDCRKCENLKFGKKGCKKYGDNVNRAVKSCAKSGFSEYKKVRDKI